MTKEEVVDAIKSFTEKLGHIPTFSQLQSDCRVTKRALRRSFGTYKAALAACGLTPHGQGFLLDMGELLLDWAKVVRQLRKIPTVVEYELHSQYSIRPLTKRFGGWLRVPTGFERFAQERGLEGDWKDVMEIIDAHVLETRGGAKTLMSPPKVILRPGIASNKPVYGPPMAEQYLMMAPVNEQGVLFLFGAVARKLGFAVLRIQTGYPDCEAMREVAPGQWQWVRIELEHESRNFLLHGHAPEFCDLIVCWKHNWEDCPLEVIELSSIVKELAVEEICCARCRERGSLTATA